MLVVIDIIDDNRDNDDIDHNLDNNDDIDHNHDNIDDIDHNHDNNDDIDHNHDNSEDLTLPFLPNRAQVSRTFCRPV